MYPGRHQRLFPQNTSQRSYLAADSFFTEDLANKVQEAALRSSQATLLSLAARAMAPNQPENRDKKAQPLDRVWNWGANNHT